MKNVMVIGVVALLGLNTVSYADITNMSDGGLEQVRGVFNETWVNPGVDFGQYNKVMLVAAEFEFRDVKKGSRTGGFVSSNQSEFWMSEKDKERMINTITTAFDREINNSSLQIVEEAGSDVLILRSGYYDVVSHLPTDMIGSGKTYARSAGAATLFVEALDSTTGEVLYRASERSEAGTVGHALFAANAVQAGVEIRRWASRLASRLVKGMENAHG
jgi:hypothetical protein